MACGDACAGCAVAEVPCIVCYRPVVVAARSVKHYCLAYLRVSWGECETGLWWLVRDHVDVEGAVECQLEEDVVVGTVGCYGYAGAWERGAVDDHLY